MDSDSPLTPDLLLAVDQTVRRFVDETVQPAAPRYEETLAPERCREIVAAAREVGLLGGEEGLGLWSRPEDAASVRLTLRTLTAIAQVRTGVAHHLHRLALGELLARRLALHPSPDLLPLIDTATAHASPAHARLLAGLPVESADCATLDDDLPPVTDSKPIVLHLAEPWQELLAPVLDRTANEARLRWLRLPRDAFTSERLPDSHGLDDSPAFRLALLPGASRTASDVDAVAAVTLLRQMLGLDCLARIALGLGVLRRGLAMAVDYARDRVQGGARIIEHAAVQELLGTSIAVETTTAAALTAGTAAAGTADELANRIALRAELLPRLGDGANAALQVLGGAGYMRDSGLEACVRDINHLRVVGGAPSTLRRLVVLLREAQA